ncbi:MAG: DUF4270 family protein [Bacteroidia bacterium]
MKQSNFLRLYTTLLFIWLLISFSSCKKADEFYLEGNTPEAPFDAAIDTLNLLLQTELQDQSQIRTNNLENDLLGTFIDPVFGRSTGNVYAQVSLKQVNPAFTSTSKADSFIIYIKVDKNAFVGNLDDVQNWKIYSLAEKLETGKNYYSDQKFALSQNIIGSYNGTLNTKDNLLRIRLDSGFAGTFLRENKSSFSDNASFGNFFKGIAIMPDTAGLGNGKGAVITTDLSDTASKMILYYDTTKSFAMQFTGNTRVNTFSHDYKNTEAGKSLENGQSNISGKAYIQSMGGVRIHVSIKDLDIFARSGKLALHKAELVFNKADSAADPLNSKQPVQLFIAPRDKDGNSTVTNFVDASPGLGYYDGIYRPADKTYHFVITNYIQDLIRNYSNNSGFTDYGLNLFVPTNELASPHRAVISAAKFGNSSPKLILTFTKLGE